MKHFQPYYVRSLGPAIIVLGLALLAGIILLLGTPERLQAESETALGATRYVARDGTDIGACGDPRRPCETIAYALCQAVIGDEVRVAAGVYSEELELSKTISLTGGFTITNWLTPTWTVNQTILDGQHAFRPLTILAENVFVDGFVVRNGNASENSHVPGVGGGILIGIPPFLVDRATLVNLRLENNVASNLSAGAGGGLLAMMGNFTTVPSLLTLHNVTVISNSATSGNFTANGGGMSIRARGVSPLNVEMTNVTIQGNTASNNLASFGGGMALSLASGKAVLRQTRILDNQTTRERPINGGLSFGGGIDIKNGELFLENVLIANNDSERGSALSVQTDTFVTSDATVNTVVMNYVTIADNNGFAGGTDTASIIVRRAGILIDFFLANTLISGSQTAIEVDGNTLPPTLISLNHVLVADNVIQVISGTAKIEEPLRGVVDYVDVGSNDYRLRDSSSGAIDKGITIPPLIDLIGTTRPQGIASDIGAFEFIPAAKSNQTITFDPLPDIQLCALPINLHATASSGLPVTFASLTPAVCTVNGTQATLMMSGTCTIEASQPGNANFNPAPPIVRSFAVTSTQQSDPTLIFDKPIDRLFSDPPFVLNARSTTGLPVSFASNTPQVCTVHDTLVTLLATGVCSVTAAVKENTDGSPHASVTHLFNILLPARESRQTLFLPVVVHE